MTIVAKSGRYFGAPFKGHSGMTQRYLLYLTIFNVVVYVVLQNRVTVATAAEGKAAPDIEVFVQYIQCMTAYSYADNRLLASTCKHGYIRNLPY